MKTHYEKMTALAPLHLRKKARRFIEYALESKKVEDAWSVLPILWDESVNDPEFVKWQQADLKSYTAIYLETMHWLFDAQKDPYSFHEFLRDNRLQGALLEVANAVGPSNAVLMMQVGHQLLSHERAGKRVYSVSPALAERLKNTELRGVRGEDLRLPYESIYIEVPKSLGMQLWDGQFGWHPLVGIYITRESQLGGLLIEDKVLEKYEVKSGWQMLLVGGDLDADDGSGSLSDDAMSFFRVPVVDGVKIDYSIRYTTNEMWRDFKENPYTTWNEEMLGVWEQQFKWAMNVVLYATWEEPGEHWIADREARQLWERIQKLPSKSKKRSRLSKKFQTLEPQRRIRLGSSIVIDRKKPVRGESESSGKEGQQIPEYLRIKTRVSGHWKRVCYGKKSSLRRMQWIEPYWKNKDGLIPVREPNHVLR